MHKKHKSQGYLNKNEILPSFRSVGCKPCDFHRLKCATSYNNFPKIKPATIEEITKE